MATLFSDFLTALGVRHTEDYSDSRFASMPFQSMFGLSNLLKEYGVGSTGVKLEPNGDASVLCRLPVPFLADTVDGFAIVLSIDKDNITYQTQHKVFTIPATEMVQSWNGVALLAAADADSVEPEYERHRIAEAFKSIKKWGLRILILALLGFAMWQDGLYAKWYGWVLTVLGCGGIWLSWMLVQKALGLENKTADAVCSALEEGGCDELARSEASSFMGIFKWSEVGLAYFSVNLLAMLLFPVTLPALAAINILCLPYTVWSILYQKFKAKVWCTLCVSVQFTLWLLFVSFLCGGLVHAIDFSGEFWLCFCAVAVCCATALLAINSFDNFLSKHFKS